VDSFRETDGLELFEYFDFLASLFALGDGERRMIFIPSCRLSIIQSFFLLCYLRSFVLWLCDKCDEV
jgi:hypothetical protein